MARLYVANLGPSMDGEWLTHTFGQFSPVTKVYVMNDRKSRGGRLSAFVTLRDVEAGPKAVEALHRSQCPDGDSFGLTVKLADGAARDRRDDYGRDQRGGERDYRDRGGYGGGGGDRPAVPGKPTGDYVRSGGKVWYECTDTYSGKSYYYTKDGDTTWTQPQEDDIPTPDMLGPQ
eukprot:TRINITY_DN22122_c0_g1_i1.p1 TRINITY_DN22122_c0_g1~~TRINITY_DN22122_c0_g1_i1.p1  ORF type:complete len:192 (+),score=49.49 TRINITY_DN22122_c0_g1_i1:52-576(+)